MRSIAFIKTLVIFLSIVSLYLFLNYYIGLKGYKLFKSFYPSVNRLLYYGFFWFIALSYILSMFLRSSLPQNIRSILSTTGVFWLGAFVYFLLLFPIIDLLRFTFAKTHLLPSSLQKFLTYIYANGLLVFVLVFFLILYGMWNASHPIITKYDVQVSKKAGSLSQLNVAMLSDIHLGSSIKKAELDKMIENTNALNPDIVFLCGDIIDENTPPYLKEYLPTALSRLHSKYGCYVVPGNHEYFTSDAQEIEKYFRGENVTFLRDKAVKITNAFYVVGREDLSVARDNDKKRVPLSTILENVDSTLPLFVLDHQPSSLEEAEENKIDLQLSGHTHEGQLFPGNLLTKKIFLDNYGYLKKNSFQLIVSSGYGTWGPPIRIGTKGELVNITVHFSN